MTIHEFSRIVVLGEGKKVNISIGQVKEVLKVTNQALEGDLYSLIKALK